MAEHRNYGESDDSEPRRGGVRVALAFLLIGIGVGALVAVMLTPKTGRQLRKELRRRYEDARETVDDWSDQASDWLQRGSDWAQTAGSKVAPIAKKLTRDLR